jgi:hypothetical protein
MFGLMDSYRVLASELGYEKIDTSNYIEFLQKLMLNTCVIGHPLIFKSILLWASLLPSSLSYSLPRVMLWGKSRTGKSTASKFIKSVRGLDHNCILGSGTSAPAFRNRIFTQKFGKEAIKSAYKGEALSDEQDVVLIVDDIDESKIKNDPNLFSMVKSGIDRSTSNVAIAQQGGGNIEFNVFCLFVFSTIHPLWSFDELKELKGRLLLIEFKHYDELTESEKKYNYPKPNYEIDRYDFTDFTVYDYWLAEKTEPLIKLMRNKEFKNAIRESKLPSNFQSLYFSLIAVGTIVEKDLYPDRTIEQLWGVVIRIVESYYFNFLNPLISQTNALELWIERYLNEQESKFFSRPYEIDSTYFNQDLKTAIKNGEIIEKADPSKINSIMLSYGYRQQYSILNKDKRILQWVKQ